ncbi:MAG TPA: diacylglycerol kinase family protein [Chitinophagales bacterium]|nr:diacylglycerol kinase family protein [Chitinophagales bacterium]
MLQAIKNFISSFVCAGRGVISLIVFDRNMRIHFLAAAAVIVLGIYFSITITEWCVAVICIAIVMTAEAINTAVEKLTDLVKPEYHPLAGRVKDMAAGAVLLAAAGAAACGVLIFWKYFFPA